MKLTDLQFKALDAICRTNGGGIHAWGEWKRQIEALYKKGLVQGKAGQQTRAVHTKEGLALWRELRKEPSHV